MTSVRIIGGGRAGGAFETALRESGLEVLGVLHRTDDFSNAADGVDVLLLAVPDRLVAETARSIRPRENTVVLHCSGSLGLDVLEPHSRRGSLHPLVTLPDAVIGSLRLRGGGFFAVAGDPAATEIALALGGQPIVVAESDRASYHAAACIAANHLVGLLGQVERIAATVGLPLEAFLPLARGALDDVGLLGPKQALTGPAARGDLATLQRHRSSLPDDEVESYDAGVALVGRLTRSRLGTWR